MKNTQTPKDPTPRNYFRKKMKNITSEGKLKTLRKLSAEDKEDKEDN